MKKELAQSSVLVLRKIQKTVQNHPKMANGKMTIQQKDKNKDQSIKKTPSKSDPRKL